MCAFLQAFEVGFSRLLGFLIGLVAASIGLIAVLIPLNLLLVKLHWGSIGWLHEAVEYTLYVGVFIGAPWVLQQGAHVRVDVVTSALPAHLAARLEQAMDGAGALLCLVLCVYGVRMAISEYVDGTLPDKDLRIPNWYMMVVFASSFALLAVEFGLRIRRARERVREERAAAAGAGF